jgi:hypothetical protein
VFRGARPAERGPAGRGQGRHRPVAHLPRPALRLRSPVRGARGARHPHAGGTLHPPAPGPGYRQPAPGPGTERPLARGAGHGRRCPRSWAEGRREIAGDAHGTPRPARSRPARPDPDRQERPGPGRQALGTAPGRVSRERAALRLGPDRPARRPPSRPASPGLVRQGRAHRAPNPSCCGRPAPACGPATGWRPIAPSCPCRRRSRRKRSGATGRRAP